MFYCVRLASHYRAPWSTPSAILSLLNQCPSLRLDDSSFSAQTSITNSMRVPSRATQYVADRCLDNLRTTGNNLVPGSLQGSSLENSSQTKRINPTTRTERKVTLEEVSQKVMATARTCQLGAIAPARFSNSWMFIKNGEHLCAVLTQ
jgi:hypothetical protein